jgi:hypothetical protein
MVLASFSRIAKDIGPARARLLLRVGEHWVFAVFTLALFKGVFIRHYYAWWLLPLMFAMAVYAMRFRVHGLQDVPTPPAAHLTSILRAP